MRRHPLYLLYGIAVLALLGVAEWRGWSFFSPSEGKTGNPRSVRDNPGAYRPHYINTGSRRYRGGK
jgi:hypothetical protein